MAHTADLRSFKTVIIQQFKSAPKNKTKATKECIENFLRITLNAVTPKNLKQIITMFQEVKNFV